MASDRFWRPLWRWCAVSLGMALLAYPYVAQAVFSDDDGHILQLAVDAPWAASYGVPEVYQQLSVVHFTPVAITFYRLMLEVFGLNPLAFVVVQLGLLCLCAALAATGCQRLTRQASAGWVMLALVFGASSFWPLVARFYTVHYLLGAVFSLCLLLLFGRQRESPWAWLGMAGLALAAALSKEIYLLLIPALVVLSLWRKQWGRAAALCVAGLVYAAMRLSALGFSLEGRQGQSFVSDWLSIDGSSWLNFGQWYVQTHGLLLVLLLVALWRSPMQLLRHSGLAVLLVLPVLAAPHAIRGPETHADRLFFAFDLALMGAVVLALHSKPWPRPWPRAWPWVAGLGVWAGAAWAGHSALAGVAHKTAADPQQAITRQILKVPAGQNTTVLTDVDYLQGGLMRVARMQGRQDLTITQNCQVALALQGQGQTLWVFDAQGQRQEPALLPQRCQAWRTPTNDQRAPVSVTQPPAFANGVLSWDLQAPAAWQVGVEFPDRAMTFATPYLHQRLVRPRPLEPYRLFAHHQGQWWFSELRQMASGAEQP